MTLTTGVLIGGIWTYHLYHTLRQKEGAAYTLLFNKAQIEALNFQVAEAKERAQRAFGLVTLKTRPLSVTRGGHCYLQVDVTVQNAGTRAIELHFGGDSIVMDPTDLGKDTVPPLSVARVAIDRNHHPQFTPIIHSPIHTFTTRADYVVALREASLLPGESSTFPFLVRLPRSNDLYLLQFSVPVDTLVLDTVKQDSAAAGWYWAARTYIPGCSKETSSTIAMQGSKELE